MVNGLLGKKLGMTQVYDSNRRLLPVTVLEVGPCGITQVKTVVQHGYERVQIGFKEVAERKLTKSELGHLRAGQSRSWRYLHEFKKTGECQLGEMIKADIFVSGEYVDVQGISKGKGFQGVIKRHNYGGGPASHGSMFHRAPGSIGSSSYPSRVWKNKALPGQLGCRPVTVKRLCIVEVRPEENLLLVYGSVPGRNGGLIVVKKTGH